MAEPCIHGEVCREYVRRFRPQRVCGEGDSRAYPRPVILSEWCPNYCRYYEPARPQGLHFRRERA